MALGAVMLATTLVACSDDATSDTATTIATTTTLGVVEPMPGDIVQVASTTDGFSTLVQAVTAAGLVETLQGAGPFTVFAPTDDAFAALPSGLLDKLLLEENRDVLVAILTYHVVAGKVTSAEVASGAAPTVEGSNIELTVGNGIKVNGATVVLADVESSNGVIHVIDQVLLPPTVDVSKL
jgi:uncharacterized surface protein with fasciclin (FAS1) repeats